jgi:hypothetical protein
MSESKIVETTSHQELQVMTPAELETIRKNEKAVFDQEVAVTEEPKLRLLLSHLYVEHLLERYIDTKVKSTIGLFGDNGLTFEKKVCLAQSLGGLPSQRVDGIRKLNALRNRCVHKFKYQAGAEQIDDLARTFGNAYKPMKAKASGNHDSLLLASLARLCGSLAFTVVEAEHKRAELWSTS